MRVTARRINDGQALKDAMAAAGVGMQALADRTKAKDPDGKGVSLALVGFLTQDKDRSRHARETCSVESAALIEDALGVPRGSLFDRVEAPSRNDPQPAWEELGNVSAQ
jgi:hypothetical protein